MFTTNSIVLAFGMPGGSELIVILLIVLLLFGGKKLPEVAKGLGKGIREFKKAREGITDAIMAEAEKEDKIEQVEKPHKTVS